MFWTFLTDDGVAWIFVGTLNLDTVTLLHRVSLVILR